MIPPTPFSLAYPRKRATRWLIRGFGRLLISLLFKITITGRGNFPRQGPLLVVGNHTAAMETVLLNIYSPWQIEMLSAADMPVEKITELVAGLYGVIPIHRGSYDRAALNAALDVLKQGGVVGLFPEGGIWEEGKKKALPGIAWLSYRSGAPVLPIGFSDTTGAINAGLQLKRPSLVMRVGELQPPARIPPGQGKKGCLQEYADGVMGAVHRLVPAGEYVTEPEIIGESFQLEITLEGPGGETIPVPVDRGIQHAGSLAKFLHRPAILKIFRVNLELPVDPLGQLHSQPPAGELGAAIKAVLNYLECQNPYLLTYRFGVREGLAMQKGLAELLRLVEWCQAAGLHIRVMPLRRYYSIKHGREITQQEQGQFQSWM